MSKEKEGKQRQGRGGKDFMEYVEEQRGKDEVGKHGYTGKSALNAVENRTSLEGSNGTGAGDKGEGVRASLGM